jgi:hypothetical protein
VNKPGGERPAPNDTGAKTLLAFIHYYL